MKYSSLSEKELISLSQDQNTVAFEELEKRNKSYIYGWILSRTKDFNNAEEVYQTTLIKCWKNLKSFKCNSQFKTWANRIALNAFRDMYRQNKRRSERVCSLDKISEENDYSQLSKIELPIGENEGLKNIKRKESMEEITKLLNHIPKKSSNVLRMHLIQEMSYREIAEKLKCPIGTIMSRLFYARKDAREAYNYI